MKKEARRHWRNWIQLPLLLTGLAIARGSGDSALTGESAAKTNSVPEKAATQDPSPEPAASPSTNSPAASPAPTEATKPANDGRIATLETSALKDFSSQTAAVQRLIADGLALTTQNLGYKYGSSDPAGGGMDCSGTVYYLLTHAGLKDVPRDSAGMYRWVWTESSFHAVVGLKEDTFELEKMRPGDLLFWTGTYKIDRDPPVTHVMIYLGIESRTGHRVMLGASEGRTYDGKSRYGVSVFDFKLPRPGAKSDIAPQPQAETPSTTRFIGYGPVPGLEAAAASGTASP
jgi:cell wall-associated NlpC family hydrolase